jgi:GTP-binding protein Era
MKPEFRSGYVAILGKPNAGKSTLMNALVGGKIAIVSDKPQTTRDRIAGILTRDEFQIVFIDTPGVIDPRDRFNEALMARAAEALEGVDVLYHIVDAADSDPVNDRLSGLLRRVRSRARFLLVNKIDRLGREGEPVVLRSGVDPQAYDEVFFISALRQKGLDELVSRTAARLQPGPMYYDPGQMSDRDERFLAAEIVREKVFRHTGAEVPYAVFTETDAFEERAGRDFISITIYVERDSQKGIIIGHKGAMLKTIGTEARGAIERLTGRPAFLELRVKVRKDWRKKEFDLANFGFKQSRRGK